METLYSIREAVELRLFPMGYRTLYTLIMNGEKHKDGEPQEDYVLAVNVGLNKKSAWRVSEDELLLWLNRRQKMLGRKGLMKPTKNDTML